MKIFNNLTPEQINARKEILKGAIVILIAWAGIYVGAYIESL